MCCGMKKKHICRYKKRKTVAWKGDSLGLKITCFPLSLNPANLSHASLYSLKM